MFAHHLLQPIHPAVTRIWRKFMRLMCFDATVFQHGGVQLLLIFARIGAVDDKLACRDTQAGQDVWTKEYEVRYD